MQNKILIETQLPGTSEDGHIRVEEESDRPAAWRGQRTALLPGRGSDQLSQYQRLDMPICWSACWLDIELEVSSISEFSPVLLWDLVMQLSLCYFCSCKWPFTFINVKINNKTCFTNICTLVISLCLSLMAFYLG